jgi:excisionase family DNA binding protein
MKAPRVQIQNYTTLAGETLEFPKPANELGWFLARVSAAVDDPSLPYLPLVEYVYSTRNPMLVPGRREGRGVATLETYRSPVFHMILDLLERKRLQPVQIESETVERPPSMSVAEAAAALGISPDAVRRAARAGNLTAVKLGNTFTIDALSVQTYRDRVGRRGPKSDTALDIRMGSEPGRSMQVKAPNLTIIGKDKGLVDAHCPRFELAAIKVSGVRKPGEKYARMFVLEPAAEPYEHKLGPFYVRGNFVVSKKINNPAEASRTFADFEPR